MKNYHKQLESANNGFSCFSQTIIMMIIIILQEVAVEVTIIIIIIITLIVREGLIYLINILTRTKYFRVFTLDKVKVAYF